MCRCAMSNNRFPTLQASFMDHVEVHKHFEPACVAYSYDLACLGSLTAGSLITCTRSQQSLICG